MYNSFLGVSLCSHLRLSEPEHISDTNRVQGLYVPKTDRMAGLEPTLSWLRVQYLNLSANGPPSDKFLFPNF